MPFPQTYLRENIRVIALGNILNFALIIDRNKSTLHRNSRLPPHDNDISENLNQKTIWIHNK